MVLVATSLLCLAACRPEPAPQVPELEPPVAKMPKLPSLEPEPPAEPLDLTPDPLPEGVVAQVDGEAVTEEEVQRLTTGAPPDAEPEAARSAALLQLVERRLIEANADRLGILVSDGEIDHALDQVARSNGLDQAQLEAAVAETGLSWEDYRTEVTAQIVEAKVLQVLGIFEPGLQPEELEARRQRLLGCLRARAEIQLGDEAQALPDNPYGLRTEIGELRLTGELGLPEEELRTVAMEAAKSRMNLCDALTTAELALQELLMERGYLEATLELPWPQEAVLPVTIEGKIEAGGLHVVGKVSFDQSALPRKKRLDADDLRRRVGLFLIEGEIATLSAMQEASREVSEEFSRAGLGVVDVEVKRKKGKERVRVDLVYRVLGGG